MRLVKWLVAAVAFLWRWIGRRIFVGPSMNDTTKQEPSLIGAMARVLRACEHLSELQNTIEEEDKKKPLPDDQLAEILKEKGYPIARRTIAKYREQLDIPVARMRKKM